VNLIKLEANRRTALFSWLFVCVLVAACITLGVFQYRWISAVSVTAREHMSVGLRTNLARVSRDFNNEIATAANVLARFPRARDGEARDGQAVAAQLAGRFAQWKSTARHPGLFDRVGLAVAQSGGGSSLELLDTEHGTLSAAEWPEEWSGIRQRVESQGGPPPEPGRRPETTSEGLSFSVPVHGEAGTEGRGPGRPFGPRGERVAWLIFHLNLPYLRERVLPELLTRDLGSNGRVDYQVEVLERNKPDTLIFESDPGKAFGPVDKADASMGLFDPQSMPFRMGEPGRGPGGPRGGFARGRGRELDFPRQGGPEPPDFGRWEMYARHRSGSLEAVADRARFRNMSVTAGILLLMLATGFALLRYTVRAQRLANMQMDFVAGVSHELRTPLTVIHTAGYNLQGKLARNAAQVEQYGAMIQRESARLRDLVEQVLQFSSASVGRVIQEKEPLSVAQVIAETVEASRTALSSPDCVLESAVDEGLPLVMGDPKALRHALENLVGNAVKYGAKDGHWIGVFASKASGNQGMVEIRVADRGPGIPEEEQRRIFDPFFRGSRAIQNQVHGTGLGLSLVKKIVEAHGGSIHVKSAPMRGTEFILRIPAAPEPA
jgi:signal transduction histidine kinase